MYVIRQNRIHVNQPDAPYQATLWYYQVPAALGPTTVPQFPSDWLLIEYVRLRGREWVNAVPPGTAMEYARKEIGRLRQAGLAGEPEDDTLPFDERRFLTGNAGPTDWMGNPNL
jgi:hypothetical protein